VVCAQRLVPPGECLTTQVTCCIVYYMSSELLKQAVTFQLNQTSGVPAYLQIVQQVEQALRMGMLRPGDQLPTVKQVVAEVAINPNTVAKAYRELEHAGLVEGRQGVGTFVLRRPQGPPPEDQARLARALRRWVETARVAGLDNQGMEAMLRSIVRSASDRGVA
jgi:GntR family transcriptional regulator